MGTSFGRFSHSVPSPFVPMGGPVTFQHEAGPAEPPMPATPPPPLLAPAPPAAPDAPEPVEPDASPSELAVGSFRTLPQPNASPTATTAAQDGHPESERCDRRVMAEPHLCQESKG